MERKVYSPWAFTENEREKSKINYDIYLNDLNPQSKSFYKDIPTDEEKRTLMCYKVEKNGYGSTTYKIFSNPNSLTNNEMALVCDSGNLCFGYRGSYPMITIHTD